MKSMLYALSFALFFFVYGNGYGQNKTKQNTLKVSQVKKVKLTPKKNSGLKVLTPIKSNGTIINNNNVATEQRKKQTKKTKKQ